MKNNIVLVPFPFDDFSSFKVRPAICLTNPAVTFSHIVIAFISSNINNFNNEIDILVKKNDRLAKGTGLNFDSVIKVNRIVKVPKKIIKRKLGKANAELSEIIKLKLKLLFELE